MFDFLTTNPALALLKKDHDTVKDLFDRFEKTEAIEEELFYPAVRKPVGKDIMNEADEEHHVAKVSMPRRSIG